LRNPKAGFAILHQIHSGFVAEKKMIFFPAHSFKTRLEPKGLCRQARAAFLKMKSKTTSNQSSIQYIQLRVTAFFRPVTSKRSLYGI